jgi:hypothetical protein
MLRLTADECDNDRDNKADKDSESQFDPDPAIDGRLHALLPTPNPGPCRNPPN